MRKQAWVAVCLLAAGCGRGYYRQAADRETYPVLNEHVVLPANAIGRTGVEPYPDSRLADPTPPDAPPKPPDDPAAGLFMAHPYKFKGAKTWEKDGVTDRIEPVGWEAALPRDGSGFVRLTQDSAAEIALNNSREYQTSLEDVYLRALSLTLNRFEFDLHWFGRGSTTYARVGASSLPAESNTLTQSFDLGFSRNLAAGGQLLVDFANSFAWEFTGRSQAVSSTFAVNLVQPLLRNFGRAVRLESLTQAERDLLYTVRDFARFRKSFWSSIAVDSGGYLDLLLQVQNVRNAKANLKSQDENYRFYQERFRGGRAGSVEVDQVFQGVLSARLSIIQAETSLQNSQDAYKLRLGLPPRQPIDLDDSLLDKFVLVESTVDKLRDDVDGFLRDRQAELDAVPPAEKLRGHYEILAKLAAQTDAALTATHIDVTAWKQQLDEPLRPGDDPESRDRALSVFAQVKDAVPEQRELLKKLQTELPAHTAAATDAIKDAAWKVLVADAKKLAGILDVAVAAQTQARINLIRLPEIDWTEEKALCYAKENRLDLQNRLGLVTDSWRKITVAANALKGDLNVVVNGALVTDPTSRNPFDFSNDASRVSVGVQFDGPLNRQAERNAYRASLILYQRSKRSYVALSDAIELQIRSDLRGLRQQRVSFEIARQSLIAAARQLESERYNLSRPNQQQNNSSEAATLRILNALSQLLNARNALAGSFINYEQQRVRLLLDLEAVQLDDRGFPTNVRTPAASPAVRPGTPAASSP